MTSTSIPMVAQHESWVSLDPIQGCPASCVYCYLEPQGLTRTIPGSPVETPEAIYQRLSEEYNLEKVRFNNTSMGGSLPIAIGNYTDICLTNKNRQFLLALLREHKQHLPEVPICIVTKAALDLAFLEAVNDVGITVIFFISLSFLPAQLEKGTSPTSVRLANFARIAQFDRLHAVHFWRPATSISVPDQQAATNQLQQLKNAGAQLSVITGLKFGPNLATVFTSQEGHALHEFYSTNIRRDYPQHEIFEPDVQEMILSSARKLSYTVYLHTSCAVSYTLGRADYNGTFRQPHLYNKCLPSSCPPAQRERCLSFRKRLPSPSPASLEQVAAYLDLPFSAVAYSEHKDTIFVDRVLTQEEQTYLTQATSFPVRGKKLVPTLEWIGSINR
jgi:DNA repair photolyase